MSEISIVTRTASEETAFMISVAKKAVEIYRETEKLNIKDNDRRILEDLVKERFPDYCSTRWRLDKLKRAVKNGELGVIDRFGNLTVSYLELKKYLFNR
jgi:hypothetical protein